ncbi:drug resistance transporter, EmrB/QacA subfamily [Halpernia humi]|uniref:Drug resistance transporter, EmrB/QacA subfamily n=1 Tax=Halpernia humi TaxID=493375 RepID=A0A1H5U4M1_9FLAO|nr:MFS transporter [Halpernia humi]SEF70014.1 drug resistance transporter, EmrB/QacA subfamily [Halpernia humi]
MIKSNLDPAVKKYLPWILATAFFMQMLDSTVLNTALPAIALDFKESPLNMQNAIISYVLTLALFMPVSGFLADKFGTRKIFILSLILFSLGSLFCALSHNLDQMVVSRVIQGLGGALMTPVGKLALIKAFNKSELLKAMNFATIPALIGPVLGPLVGGYLVDYLSWHWIFIINLPIGLLGIILGIKFLPNYVSKITHFDFKGLLIFASAALLLSISLELMGKTKNLSFILLIFILGFLLLYYYYRYARKTKDVIFPLNLFLVRTFRVGILGNLACRLGISSIPLLIPFMIQIAYGQSAVVSGWIVAPMALTAMFGKSAVISILNYFGYRNTLMFNSFIIGFLILTMAIPGINTSIYWFLPSVAALGFFNSIHFTAMNTIAIADLRNDQTSSGNSLLSVNQQIAIGFGITIGLAILRFYQNIESIEIHEAFRNTFLTIGTLTVLSGFVFRRLHFRDGDNMKSQ